MGKPTPIHGIRHARILQTRRPTHRASARFPPPTLPTVSFITPSDADNTMDTVASPRWAQDNNSLLIVHTESSRDDRGWRGDSGPSVEHSTGERIHALATTENLYGLTPFGETAGAPVLDFTSAMPLTAASFVAASFGISDTTSCALVDGLAVGPQDIVAAESSRCEETNPGGGTVCAARTSRFRG
jgi:hypothetical protein